MSIASEIERLQTAKASLKTSIEGKGVTVPEGATLDDYPALVDSISGGGGNYTIASGNSVQSPGFHKFVNSFAESGQSITVEGNSCQYMFAGYKRTNYPKAFRHV